jgi:hypothetical protein
VAVILKTHGNREDAPRRQGRSRGAGTCARCRQARRDDARSGECGGSKMRRSWAPRLPSRAITAIPACCAPRSTARWCTAFRRKARVLKEGDIVSIDCGAVSTVYYGDSAITVPVGGSPEASGCWTCNKASLRRRLRPSARRDAGRYWRGGAGSGRSRGFSAWCAILWATASAPDA